MLSNTVHGYMTEKGDDITIWLRCKDCNICGEWDPTEVVNNPEKTIECDYCKKPLEYAYITIVPKDDCD